MRFQTFMETYFQTTSIHGVTTQIFINPDSGDLETLFGKNMENGDSVRGLIMDDTNDLYVWRRNVLHGEIINSTFGRKNNWDTRPWLPISIDVSNGKPGFYFTAFEYGASPLRKKLPYDPDEGTSKEIIRFMKTNPNVKSLGYEVRG